MNPFHGGALDRAIAEHGGGRADWLDLSTGINPVACEMPPVEAEAWARLPDTDAYVRCLGAARAAYRVPKASAVLAAPGTQALIEALPRVLAGRTATIIAPAAGTYREHAHCCAKAGLSVRHAGSPETVAEDETLAILVNPNNPDGHIRARAEIATLAARLAGRGGTLVVDEAFCDTVPEASVIPDALPATVVLRSFGKFFGLAGLRLGFAVAAPAIVERLGQWFGPWAVSGPALAVGARLLGDEKLIQATRRRLESDSNALANLLERNGFSIEGRNGLFVLAGHVEAAAIATALARRHILVRPFPDRPGRIRFGLCADGEALARLDRALGQAVAQAA